MYVGPAQIPLKAADAVLVRRVVRLTAPNTGNEATANSVEPLGISANFTKYPPGTASDAGQCADAGDPIPYIARGGFAEAVVGTGGVTGGTRVEAGAAGVVVAASSAGSGKWTVGIAQSTAAAGAIVLVYVDPAPNV